MSAAHRAAPTVELIVKKMAPIGIRFSTTAAVPNLLNVGDFSNVGWWAVVLLTLGNPRVPYQPLDPVVSRCIFSVENISHEIRVRLLNLGLSGIMRFRPGE